MIELPLRDEPVATLAEFVHSNRSAILVAWKTRVGSLAAFEGPSPLGEGERILDWLSRSLEEQGRASEQASEPPREQRFGAPRAIAELALLIETIDRLRDLDDVAKASLHHVIDGAIARSLALVVDETDAIRKRSEEEQARVVEELSRAVHISEMFVGILSHDLRSPLGAILGGAELLGMDPKGANHARILKLVVSSGQRMSRMIDQLLDFTRARLGEGIPLEREEFDLGMLVRDVVAEGQAVTVGALLRSASQGDTAGTWDRDRISQILSNLVGNAVQHGHARGSIDVVVDGTDTARVTVSVHNEGVISPAMVPIIFNPFRGTLQKRGKSSGLGLGLFVARQIALAHGGELELRATATGTIFTLSLPRAAPSTTPSIHELVHEEELAEFERMAAPPAVSMVTAQLFGAAPLHERVPLEHADIVEHYATLLETALNRKAYRGDGEGLAEELRAVAERLGDLGAGPREVTDVHARALRRAAHGATAARTQALLVEGRLLALEVMGNLASYYRRRSRGQVRSPGSGRPKP